MAIAKSQQKGANGRIAEYACAYNLAELLTNANLTVVSDIDQLKKLSLDEQQKYSNHLTAHQIKLAVDSGTAIAQDIFNNIQNNGKDLVFVEYDFVADQHSYDIEPTGAKQNKGTSDDMVIHLCNTITQSTHKILISLKVHAGTSSSQGSKSSVTSLYKMFVDPTRKKVKEEEFGEFFGTTGNEFVNSINEFKKFGRSEWWNSSQGQQYRQDKLALGSNPKSYGPTAKNPGTNQLRSSALGEYFAQHKGYISEHRLSQQFVESFNYGKRKYTGTWQQFNQGFKQAIGFDEVITYKAVCNDQGVTGVVNSATNPAYQQVYRALNSKIDVDLTYKPNSSGIGVEIKHDNIVIKSLSLAMWKEGTIQFKFDSDRESE